MAFKNENSVQEDILFKPQTSTKGDVDTEVLFDASNSDVNTEVLFKSGFEDNIEFQEPRKREEVDLLFEEQLFDNKSEILEEALFDNGAITEEPIVFSQAGVQEENVSPIVEFSNLEPVSNEQPTVAEEQLSFSEPMRPVLVNEEVLFDENNEKVTIDSNIDDSHSILSEELSSLAVVSAGDINLSSTATKTEYVEKNFAQKLLEADKEILARYDELKNFMLLYKGVKSRVSNDFDSFNIGRTQLIKLGFSTQSLKLYLNLEYDKVETRLKCKDVSNKKAYKEVPVFLRIKSPRAMRNAKYLIEQVVKRFDLKENPRAVYVDSIKILEEKAKTYS